MAALPGGGLVVWTTGWNLADPIASALIGTLVPGSSWRLLRSWVTVLLEGVPEHLDVDEIREALRRFDGVRGVHDLHVWSITSGMVSLSAHVEREQGRQSVALLEELGAVLEDRFQIRHCTIQIEPVAFDEEEPAW